MCQILSLFLLQRLKENVRRPAWFQQHRHASCHQVFFPARQGAKGTHVILTETLGEHAPLYATVKNWVAQFKRGDFSTCDAPRPGQPETVTSPAVIDQIHELILEDRRILAKSIARQLGISHVRVGSIIHEDLDMRKLSAKRVLKCLNTDQIRGLFKKYRTFGRQKYNYLFGCLKP